MIDITPDGRRILMQLLERRSAQRAVDDAGRRTPAPGRFLRLHAITGTGLLGVVFDRPRATDRTLELGAGELLLVDESLARAMDGFVLDRDERGSLSLRTIGARREGDARCGAAPVPPPADGDPSRR